MFRASPIAAKEEMPSGFGPWCAETCIGADECQAGNPHQGVASQKLALHRGIEWSNSTLVLGLREWWGKTALGTAVDDDSGDQNPPCVLIGAGIDNNMDNPTLSAYSFSSGAAVVFPYDSSVPDTPGSLDGSAGGIMNGLASVGDQSVGLSNGSTSTLANTYNNLASANCGNFTAVMASGSAQAFATGVTNGNITQQALGCTSNLIYLSPGAPSGLPATGISTSIVTGNPTNPVEAAVIGPTFANTDPLFLLDVTDIYENDDYGHEPDQQLLDGAPGLPTSSNCNSATN